MSSKLSEFMSDVRRVYFKNKKIFNTPDLVMYVQMFPKDRPMTGSIKRRLELVKERSLSLEKRFESKESKPIHIPEVEVIRNQYNTLLDSIQKCTDVLTEMDALIKRGCRKVDEVIHINKWEHEVEFKMAKEDDRTLKMFLKPTDQATNLFIGEEMHFYMFLIGRFLERERFSDALNLFRAVNNNIQVTYGRYLIGSIRKYGFGIKGS